MDCRKLKTASEILGELIQRYPCLAQCESDISSAYGILLDSYRSEGKLLIAGNGGSAADSDHISGELTKSFMFRRTVPEELGNGLAETFGDEGKKLASGLEGGLPAIPLPVFNGSNTAFANDVGWETAFAQLVNALGLKNDVFLGITTSGNSKNVVNALMVARVKGIKSIVLTGGSGGKCKGLADVCIRVPETETFKIQELHLPVYHALCSMVEATLFEPRTE